MKIFESSFTRPLSMEREGVRTSHLLRSTAAEWQVYATRTPISLLLGLCPKSPDPSLIYAVDAEVCLTFSNTNEPRVRSIMTGCIGADQRPCVGGGGGAFL